MGDGGLDERVGEHFGRVPTYTIVDTTADTVHVVPNTSLHMPGGRGHPPEIMVEHSVDALVCQGLGRRAVAMFEDFGIAVFIGASGTVRNAVADFEQGNLRRADEGNSCQQHAFRDRHHHHEQ
jgi:predicted Fe-Mo cluster-binding NifX family protein